MRRAALATTVTLVLSAGAGAEEADPAAGKALHEAHCFQCHGTQVYTRADRRVRDLSQLRNQVQRCEQMLGLKWFETDIENVTAYLNQNYYKF
jgi:mono/diheme cytochrome c family protein